MGIALWAEPLVGFNFEGVIANCYIVGGQVNGFANVGGLVGENSKGLIYRCYSTCQIPRGYNIRGLAGHNSGIIANRFSVSTVVGSSGGIDGLVSFNSGWIQNSYSAGEVSAQLFAGGLIGCNLGDRVFSSFWNIETSDHMFSAGGIGFTTEQLVSLNSFQEYDWNFQAVWGICESISTTRRTGGMRKAPKRSHLT